MTKQKCILIQFILIFCVFIINPKVIAFEAPSRCYNPSGRNGFCVSIYKCPSLINVLKTQQPSAFAFARKSKCLPNGKGRQPYVCCTSETGFTTRNDLNGQRIIFPEDPDNNNTMTTLKPPKHNDNHKTSNMSLFPKPPVCGPITITNRIYGGDVAELGEFPWLANLEYKKPNGDLVSVCAGNIINQRYLLTAAHCVKGKIKVKVGELVSLRVGDQNTQTLVDCKNAVCLDAFQRMGVANIIVHAGYNSSHRHYYHHYNDIALIKTNRDMQYSFSVAPICLPDAVLETKQLETGMKLYVAGWGHNGTFKNSAEKRKVELPYVENKDCSFKQIAPEQMCAGGEFMKDSCNGDSGGGLARLIGGTWILEGIVSYGRGCGLERPGVYTRVRSYLNWIHANVHL